MGVDITEAVGRLRIRQCKVRGWGLGQKPETEQLWLNFRHAGTVGTLSKAAYPAI